MTPVTSFNPSIRYYETNKSDHPVDLRIVDLAKTTIPKDHPNCEYLDVSYINDSWNDVTLEASGRIIFEAPVNTSNSLYLKAKGSVELTKSSVDGVLWVSSGSNIRCTESLNVTGASKFESTGQADDVYLMAYGNRFSGRISIVCGGSACLTNWGRTDIAADTGRHLTMDLDGELNFCGETRIRGNLLAMASNDITQSDSLYVYGQSRFVSDVSDRRIYLTNRSNYLVDEIHFLTRSTGCNWANVSLFNSAYTTFIQQSEIYGDFHLEAPRTVYINQTHVAGNLTIDAGNVQYGTHNHFDGKIEVREDSAA